MLHISPWKTVVVLGVILLSTLFTLPNALPSAVRAHIPGFLPSQPANLGLDLQGGSHLEFQVSLDEVYTQRLQSLEASMREAFNKAKIGYTGLRTTPTNTSATPPNLGEVSVTIRDEARVDETVRIIEKDLSQPVGSTAIGIGGKPDLQVTREAGGRLRIRLTEPALAQLRTATISQSIEVVRRRIDETGTKEPIIQRQGADRVVVEVPGVSNPEEIKRLMAQTARLTFHKVDTSVSLTEAQSGRVPPGSVLMPYQKPEAGRSVELLEKRAVLTGQDLKSARVATDQAGLPAVAFTLNPRGAKVFGDYTAKNVGQRFAIVLDNKVISAPYIRSPILGGSGEISGAMDITEANELSILLNAGALPASLKVVNERTVGAELGADSIDDGVHAAVIGSILVIIFMFVAYGTFGAFANIALMANIIILLGVITMLRATLTLPGIAGIVLTIGMAVDSNVLIYERIKEELRGGKSMIASLDNGFTRAFGTILDANLTTLIASLVLFQLGAGPVRGFAVAHAIGTLTTIFTAYTLTRLIVTAWFRWTKPKRIPIDPRPLENGKLPLKLIPDRFAVPFMKIRNFGFSFSGLAVIASIVLPIAMGLNFSIDYVGGTVVEIRTQGSADLAKFREFGNGIGLEGHVQVQEFGAPDDIVMRFEAQPGGDAAQQAAAAKVKDALQEEFGGKAQVVKTEVVGPTVGQELVTNSVVAVLIGIALMMVYVWFRFEWQFGVGAVVGLFHDILLTLGVFALFQLEFNIAIIAAMLTIVGYSMNDKVVIYDRIRENLRKYKRLELKDLIDQSLNETLARTSITAITTLLALGALYFFGGEVIRTFVFAMIFGVFVGTYSSIFISAPFLLYTGVKRDWSKAAAAGASPAGSKA